jgi:hypothetical protein
MYTITVESDKPMVVIPLEEYENMKKFLESFSIFRDWNTPEEDEAWKDL